MGADVVVEFVFQDGLEVMAAEIAILGELFRCTLVPVVAGRR